MITIHKIENITLFSYRSYPLVYDLMFPIL